MVDSQQSPIRILIADDHGLFRESLARLLAAEPDFEIIAHCASIDEANNLLRTSSADVLLLDFDFGDSDCIEFVRSAFEQGFSGKILLVTAGVNTTHAAELVRLGVSGIFLKHDLPALLTQAIRDVAGGKVYLDQNLLKGAVAVSVKSRLSPTPTQRERQVLSLILEGLSNKKIGDRLGVSESSVKASIQQLFSKTGVRTRSQLVRVALEQFRDLL